MNKRKNRSANNSDPGSDHQNQLGVERLIFFSDAVFAIAITLLALEIRLPAGETIMNDSQLSTQLINMWHQYLAYLISFMAIGLFWIGHHRKFMFIKRYDSRLLMLNLLMLMMIAFVPFPSSILSEYSNRSATILYALTMTLVGFFMAATWWHAARDDRLIDPDLDAKRRSLELAAPLAMSAVFLLSIGVAFIDPDIAKLMWLLILPVSMVMNRS